MLLINGTFCAMMSTEYIFKLRNYMHTHELLQRSRRHTQVIGFHEQSLFIGLDKRSLISHATRKFP